MDSLDSFLFGMFSNIQWHSGVEVWLEPFYVQSALRGYAFGSRPGDGATLGTSGNVSSKHPDERSAQAKSTLSKQVVWISVLFNEALPFCPSPL